MEACPCCQDLAEPRKLKESLKEATPEAPPAEALPSPADAEQRDAGVSDADWQEPSSSLHCGARSLQCAKRDESGMTLSTLQAAVA